MNKHIFTFCFLFFGFSIIGFGNSYSEEFEENFIIDDSKDMGFVSENLESKNMKNTNIEETTEEENDSTISGIRIDTETSKNGDNNEEKSEIEEIEQPKVELPEVNEKDFADIVVLQGLDKITAKISTFEVKVGESTQFKRLEIHSKKCWKSPPEENPENKVLLEIHENRLDGKKEKLFYGWMFSSSPGLSSLEHPVYDITLIECRFNEDDKDNKKENKEEKNEQN